MIEQVISYRRNGTRAPQPTISSAGVSTATFAGLPLVWILFLVLGMLAAVVALTAVPANISTRQPIAQILQSESA